MIKFIDENPMIMVGIVMLIVWFSLLTFFFIKADEITKDPCNICAERVGENYKCFPEGLGAEITYYQNGSIEVDDSKIKDIFYSTKPGNLTFNMTALISNN